MSPTIENIWKSKTCPVKSGLRHVSNHVSMKDTLKSSRPYARRFEITDTKSRLHARHFNLVRDVSIEASFKTWISCLLISNDLQENMSQFDTVSVLDCLFRHGIVNVFHCTCCRRHFFCKTCREYYIKTPFFNDQMIERFAATTIIAVNKPVVTWFEHGTFHWPYHWRIAYTHW